MYRTLAVCCVLVALLAPISAASSTGNAPSPELSGASNQVEVSSGDGLAPGLPASAGKAQFQHYQRYISSYRQLAGLNAGCRIQKRYNLFTYWNLARTAALFRSYQQVYYCRTSTLVTYFYRYRWVKMSSIVPIVDWNPWEFKGNVPSGNDCPNEHCFIRGYRAPARMAVTKGHFNVCAIELIGWCNNIYVLLELKVFGDGRPHISRETMG